MAPETRFADKSALVTGGASGIGEGIVRRFLSEGGSVAAIDINADRLKSLTDELGDRFLAIEGDVTREADVEAAVATTVERFGSLNVGFNVAGPSIQRITQIMSEAAARGEDPGGAMTGFGGIADASELSWDYTIDVCAKGVFLSMKHEARQMLAQGSGGAIVVISSLNSEVPMYGGAAYSAAKAAAVMLAECGALELTGDGIRVNAISPGLVETPLTAGTFQNPEAVAAYMERIPLKRAAQPADIASAACFLASDDASYISGVNLFVDGAWATTTYPDLRASQARMQEQLAQSAAR